MTALSIAMTTPRLTIVYTVWFEVASMKYCIGTAEVVNVARLGAPMMVAVNGISSAATVITSDQRMARAMFRLGPAVYGEAISPWKEPITSPYRS